MYLASLEFPELLEGAMLICFGISWPVNILKALRTRRMEGKSPGFMTLILIGYLCGMGGKFLRAGFDGRWPEPVTVLYVVNAVLVAIDLALYARYRPAALAARARPKDGRS